MNLGDYEYVSHNQEICDRGELEKLRTENQRLQRENQRLQREIDALLNDLDASHQY